MQQIWFIRVKSCYCYCFTSSWNCLCLSDSLTFIYVGRCQICSISLKSCMTAFLIWHFYFSLFCLIENPKVTVEHFMYKTCDKKNPDLLFHCCCCLIFVFSKWAKWSDFMHIVLRKPQKYTITGIQFYNKENHQKLIHVVGKK